MKYFLTYSLYSLFLFIRELIKVPISRASRHRLSAVYQTLRYPYFGDRLNDLSVLLTKSNLQVVVPGVKTEAHNADSFEMLAICSLLKDSEASQVFEIGTYNGRTTRAMAMNISGTDPKVYTLNLPPDTQTVDLPTSDVDVQLSAKVISGECFLGTAEAELITQLWGDSATYHFEPFFGKMDFIFIDGAHSKEYVARDTENALKMIKPSGGIIAWHDAHLFGVVQFLEPWISMNRLDVRFIKNTSLAVGRVRNGEIIQWKL
jgi:hypothetical protein